jgi:hypothetical protein
MGVKSVGTGADRTGTAATGEGRNDDVLRDEVRNTEIEKSAVRNQEAPRAARANAVRPRRDRAAEQPHAWSNLSRKQRGEMAEAAFLAKAVSLGFCVSKPFGESSRYDLIVDNGSRLLRIQVKSAFYRTRGNSYKIQARGNDGRPYTATEIDFLVAWVVPVDAWYVFPVDEFQKYSQMELFPTSRWGRSKFEKFREAWETVR